MRKNNMDKKQVHKQYDIDKVEALVKFVKQNKGTIASVVSAVATIITAVKIGKKE